MASQPEHVSSAACAFPRCVDGEKPPHCGNCEGRETPYAHEYDRSAATVWIEEPCTDCRGTVCGRYGVKGGDVEVAKFGHHPDPLIDAEVEVGRLEGLLAEAHGGLRRALDYRAATPEGLSIKHDVRDALRRAGFVGAMGERSVA